MTTETLFTFIHKLREGEDGIRMDKHSLTEHDIVTIFIPPNAKQASWDRNLALTSMDVSQLQEAAE